MQGFEKLIKLLCDNKVNFVIIGGFAAVVHGVSILTQDIDLAISFDEVNLDRLLKTIGKYRPVHRENKRPLFETIASGIKFNNLYLITDLGPVDLLGTVAGIGTFSDVAKNSIVIDLFGEKCRVLDIDGLISAKREMKRPKDKETIIQLMAIKERRGR